MLYLVSLLITPLLAQSGHVLDGMGAVNQGMGGVGAGLAVEPIGALHWNPAAMGGLPEDQTRRFSMSLVAFSPTTSLSSSVNAGSFGPGFPASNLSGESESQTSTAYIPSFVMVNAPKNSDWLYGIAMYGISGFGVDYAVDPNNPILTPQPPAGMGFGAIFSEYTLLQISPTIARRLDSEWTVAFAPTLNVGTLAVSPFSGTNPDDANGDGFPSYPINKDAETALGMGFKIGVYWQGRHGWSAGAAYKSPIWFGDFDFDATDELGAQRSYSFDLDYPSISSVGIGFTDRSGWKVGADLRWVDYENTSGFDKQGFAADGSVLGFHWRSIPIIGVGGEFPITDRFSLLGGFAWNASPIRSEDAFFNVAAPAIIQTHLSTGFRWRYSDSLELSLAYKHGFANDVSGPFQGATGPIAGTSVESDLQVDSLTFGLSWDF
ncbi:MAG: hypothetical protein COA70_06455 [Planctomycetota bacterium]|nr:MAG: hypothetical protein COA70_06455 [Planctomycetota bacterium]